MVHFLAIGTILGLSAGFAPGPLLALVISETLQHGVTAGIKVALAPILTDLPIIVLTVFLVGRLSDFHNVLGAISLAGGIFVIFLGYENIRAKGLELKSLGMPPRPLARGVMVNALSPHPYLFWFSVGAPMVTRAWSLNVFAPFAFIGSFYALLVGVKIVLAVSVGKTGSLLQGRSYIYTMRFLGILLWGLGGVLFCDGLKILGIL